MGADVARHNELPAGVEAFFFREPGEELPLWPDLRNAIAAQVDGLALKDLVGFSPCNQSSIGDEHRLLHCTNYNLTAKPRRMRQISEMMGRPYLPHPGMQRQWNADFADQTRMNADFFVNYQRKSAIHPRHPRAVQPLSKFFTN
jgi:hypothetical protein